MANFIILLSAFQMIFSNAAPPFDLLQIPIEISLLLLLSIGILDKQLRQAEMALLFACVAVTLAALPFADPFEFATNAKQNIIAALALIYFSRNSFHHIILLPIFGVTSILTTITYFSGHVAQILSNLSSKPEYNASRFGGIFLETHFNAFFIASIFLFYRRKINFFGVDVAIIYFTGSKFVLIAYLAAMVWTEVLNLLPRRWHFAVAGIALSAITGVAAIILIEAENIVSALVENEYNSFAVILGQIADPNYYMYLINVIPRGHYYIDGWDISKFIFHSGHNEIGYFSLFLQCGILFGSIFLFSLIRAAPLYAVLILVSLFHNQFLLSPLMIGIFLEFGKGDAKAVNWKSCFHVPRFEKPLRRQKQIVS